MALSATVHTFEIELADVDRGVYESLSLKVARHPSETEDFLLTRVLAYCLEYADGIAFSRGLARLVQTRRTTWGLSVTEGHLYVTIGGDTLEGEVRRLALAAP